MRIRTGRQCLAAVGLGLLTFALVALSGPGRIDIVDGQTRYEVAASLVDHGDAAIRDSRVWFQVFPGRGARPYTTYRLPQSILGAAAIGVSDLQRVAEDRRRFFFTLTGAAAAAALAVAYFVWFSARGWHPCRAAIWSWLGIVATPAWFYGTSTFDDILGAAAVTAALVFAALGNGRRSWWPHLAAGAMIGLAFHCKQPLMAFALVVIAAGGGSKVVASTRRQIVLGLLLLAIAAQVGYDRYKFPADNAAERETLQQLYVPAFPGDLVAGASSLAVSPGKGLLWYCPAVVLAIAGWISWRRAERGLVLAMALATGAFVGFVSYLVYFGGDPAWGPRYLTPVVALLWLAAPDGAARLGRAATSLLLAASVLIQLLALAVDPHRLYVERSLPSAFYHEEPWVYFDPAVSHLVQRPREILEIVADMRAGRRAAAFSPAPEPTFAFPVLDYVDPGPAAVERYQVLAAFRPFWISQRWLPESERPVSIASALAWLAGGGLVGASLLWFGLRRSPPSRRERSDIDPACP